MSKIRKLFANKDYSKIIMLIAFFVVSDLSYAREIQCRLSDAFNKPSGALLFDYNDSKRTLTLVKTMGSDLVFMDSENSWINEVVSKVAKDISNDSNLIKVSHSGEYNWEFELDRRNGTIQVNQSRMSMYWTGRCGIVDRSNKF
jgi:hypothetical protein